MTESVSKPLVKSGTPVVCPVCRHDQFHSREALLNTRGATFFRVDWLNKKAQLYVCDRCGHILWFAET